MQTWFDAQLDQKILDGIQGIRNATQQQSAVGMGGIRQGEWGLGILPPIEFDQFLSWQAHFPLKKNASNPPIFSREWKENCLLRSKRAFTNYVYKTRQVLGDPGNVQYALWQYGLWRFLAGGTKLERFLPKNQLQQMKYYLNFENWWNGDVSKIAKI